MKKPINPEKIRKFETMRKPLNLQDAIKEANRCLLCHDAPCNKGCPAGTDPARFIRQIRFYNFKGAARTIRNNNAMGSVCSFLCPVEKLCEKECSVLALEDPININGLQRFAWEYGKNNGIEKQYKGNQNQGNVAIIGAGPAGMSCAAELAKMDYKVTIFEKEEESGGVAKWNIPDFRITKEAVDYDLSNLKDLGVEIIYNKKIESQNEIPKMLNNGYQSVFLASGISEAYELKLFEEYSNTTNYSAFLRDVKTKHNEIDLKGKNVAIIGGGSVAIDSATSAAALGAKKVYLISLEHLDELPADKEEIKIARLMNIVFKAGSQITDVISTDNEITGLKGIEIEWIEQGKFNSENARQIDGTEFSLNVDLVIQAIGTRSGKEINKTIPGLITKGNGIVIINENRETNIPGVFAGGDVISTGATVVQAIGDGKNAAKAIDNFIKKGGR